MCPKLFSAWFSTPTIFGGFGAGQDGRVRLAFEKMTTREFDITFDFKPWSNRKSVVETAKHRIGGLLPLPGITRVYRLERFKGVEAMPSTEAGLLTGGKNIRCDWIVGDLRKFSDAYYRKLLLEWKLIKRKRIVLSDLPVAGPLSRITGIDKVYRRYRQLVSECFTLENWKNSEVYYSRIKDFGNQVWAGICMRMAMEKWGFWKIGSRSTWDLDSYRRALASLLVSLTNTYEASMHYRFKV
jgi:hypothetical protein